MDKLIYSFTETAKLFSISRGSLYKLMGEGLIRGFRIGRTWRFSNKEIDRFINSQMEGSIKVK